MGHSTEFSGEMSIRTRHKGQFFTASEISWLQDNFQGHPSEDVDWNNPSAFIREDLKQKLNLRHLSYNQWEFVYVPANLSETKYEEIGVSWDGGEKFYDWVEWMKIIAAWCETRDYELNGKMQTKGDHEEDTGILESKDNKVTFTSLEELSDLASKERVLKLALTIAWAEYNLNGPNFNEISNWPVNATLITEQKKYIETAEEFLSAKE